MQGFHRTAFHQDWTQLSRQRVSLTLLMPMLAWCVTAEDKNGILDSFYVHFHGGSVQCCKLKHCGVAYSCSFHWIHVFVTQVDENMKTAFTRDGAREGKFYFRKDVVTGMIF